MTRYGPRIWGVRDSPDAGGAREVVYQVGDPLAGEVYYAAVRPDHIECRRGSTRGPLVYEARTTGEPGGGEPAGQAGSEMFAILSQLRVPKRTSKGGPVYAALRVGALRGPLHCEDGPAEVYGDGGERWYLWGAPKCPNYVMHRLKNRRVVSWEGPSDCVVGDRADSATYRYWRKEMRNLAKRLGLGEFPSEVERESRAEWHARFLERLYRL